MITNCEELLEATIKIEDFLPNTESSAPAMLSSASLLSLNSASLVSAIRNFGLDLKVQSD
jgi:hypothetical protein